MTKLSLPELKKQLKTYKAEELISIIIDCYKSSADVKKYIHMMLEPESTENQLFDEARRRFCTSLIYYVELGVEFTNDYGDMYESSYYSLASMYQNVLNKINIDHGSSLYYVFQDRLRAIVRNTSEVGWGFHDQLADLFYNFAVDYEEDPEVG
ncbi:hypothetical protein [Paenibacillus sp. SI8]|uniref:hypothetical protein n=1 Tax=unclassified Paenibacillus TaxID=185978 RepID=UPI0034664E84